MQKAEVLRLLEDSGAILRGPFRLHSGLHSDVYVQSALVLQNPDRAEVLCRELASLSAAWKPEVVEGKARYVAATEAGGGDRAGGGSYRFGLRSREAAWGAGDICGASRGEDGAATGLRCGER